MDLCQPPGRSVVDILPLHGVLYSLLAIQVPLLETIRLLKIFSSGDGVCRDSTAYYSCHYMSQSGRLYIILSGSTRLCGEKCTSSFLFSHSSTDCCSGIGTVSTNTHIMEVLFRGI